MNPDRRIVLYYPRLADTRRRAPAGLDVLPLSVLTLAGLPLRDGYDVVVIDGNLSESPEAAHKRVVDACEGALVFGATGILGHQVADAELAALAVRAKHPNVARIVGGWFASVLPELYLEDGLFDAVCVGQGELTFRDFVAAAAAGEPFDSVPGLVLQRDGQLVQTDHRRVVDWNELVNCPWQLIDFEPYRVGQLRQRSTTITERLPRPRAFTADRPHVGIAYFGSFGCPEPCTFCCSPEVTNRRWKAMPAERMLDDLQELSERWDFDVVRFHDANWGVSEKRVREFCEGMLERGLRFHWFPMMQAHSVLKYAPRTLDLMAETGCYVVNIGAEAGSDEMMAKIGKTTSGDDNLNAAVELDRRGMETWLTYIIGFPDEERESMLATIEQARRIRAAAPGSHPGVWPYHPIPGTPMYRRAIELGFVPARSLSEWGKFGDYHMEEIWRDRIPPDIKLRRRLFQHYTSLSLGVPRGRVGWWERRARRRLASGSWRGARVEAKAFDVYKRVSDRVGVGGDVVSARKRIVLYSPVQADPAGGIPYSKDVLPLSLLTIAGGPVLDGYEVVLIDGELFGPEEGHRRAVEACEGALLFATTGILGYQVTDGYFCSQRVRARHPDLPLVIGGWFASTAPELQLETGLYDAVALGQGEVTFREIVQAIDAGEPLDSISGLALWRDGGVVRTEARGAVGWGEIPPVPWHLLDFEPYREQQLAQRDGLEWEAVPPPPDANDPRREAPYSAITYFSSYGCPLQCTFCCSPEVSGLRWKAMPAERMLEDILGLRERWGFDVVRFVDANYGVMEKRVRAFAEGIVESGERLWQLGYMQAPSVCRFDDRTIDAMAESGFYDVLLGGETGDMETMATIKKTTREGENLRATQRLTGRGIGTQLTYIIGFPGEAESSMRDTLEEVRRIQVACPTASPQVWPFRPIPGTPLFRQAIALGYPPPKTLPEWGAIGDYRRDETWRGKIPVAIARRRKLFHHFAGLSKGIVRDRVGWWERRAQRRLATGDFRLGRVEAKAFDLFHKLERLAE